MSIVIRSQGMPFGRTLVFWGGVLLAVLQGERLCLFPKVVGNESPPAGLLLKTFLMGLCNDLLVAVGGVAVAIVLAGLAACVFLISSRVRKRQGFIEVYRQLSIPILVLLTAVLMCISTADFGYYQYNHHHLDFVFFEYLDELFHGASEGSNSQAAEQTEAELSDAGKWIGYSAIFWTVVLLLIAGWKIVFRAFERFKDNRWGPVGSTIGLLLIFGTTTGAVTGVGRVAWPHSEVFQIQSEAYYGLSQNPVLFAITPLRDAFLSRWSWSPASLPQPISLTEAIQQTHATLGNEKDYPYADYPLVRAQLGPELPYFDRPVNVLLIFVEGLDRRFLERVLSPGSPVEPQGLSDSVATSISVTPFLDRFKLDSLYFSHFFSNGVQTARGVFSTLCSSVPRQGTAEIKTRFDRDYLCLPSVLRTAGYTTEMVVSLDGDLPGFREFLNKNGIDHYYGEKEFPPEAERLGIGLTDGALLDFVADRVESLQSSRRPFFLTTLTAGMHHPFVVPDDHGDVNTLRHESDQYVAALRYFDLVFERFITRLRSKGLLRDTVVLVLGDHGRHEALGRTDVEQQVGHFLSPLYFWVDESLRSHSKYRPRVVHQVASQVDITPTLLAMNGLIPKVAPFVGQNLTCFLTIDCLDSNRAYLSSVYDDLIGIADSSGLWTYSFRRNALTVVDLDLQYPAVHLSIEEPDAKRYVREMTSLYLASNMLLEQNKIWSPQFLRVDNSYILPKLQR